MNNQPLLQSQYVPCSPNVHMKYSVISVTVFISQEKVAFDRLGVQWSLSTPGGPHSLDSMASAQALPSWSRLIVAAGISNQL